MKWQEKLRTRYGWFKSDSCKHIIFDVSREQSPPGLGQTRVDEAED